MRTMRCLLHLTLLLCALGGSAAAGQSVLPIHSIMTNLPNSPYLGQQVTVSGVVVGVMASGSYYLTAPGNAWDTDPATAEGIQIYAATGANAACAMVGNAVTVTGTVVDGTAQNGALTPGTGISPTACTVTGNGSVGSAVTLVSASAYGQDLPVTGMPVANTLYFAVSPTSGITDPGTGLVSSTGQFWTSFTLPLNNHLFKAVGLKADDFYPPPPAPAKGSSPGIPAWSGNPQRLLVDSTTFGGAPIDIGVGQSLKCTVPAGLTAGATTGVGVIDYSLGYNRLLLFKTTTCQVSGTIAPSVTAPADVSHFHVATLNLNLFHSLAHSPTPALYQLRLTKAALAIVNVLGKPDILSIQEVEDLPTLQAIADACTTLAGAGTTYQAYFQPANDRANLGLGFLINTDAVSLARSPFAIDAGDTFTRLNGSSVPLFERPPFVIDAELLRAGLNYLVTVVNIDLTSRDGIDDPVNGPNVWERRGQQAVAVSRFADAEQKSLVNLIIAGEFNAYSFSDGFVDPTDIIAGAGVPAPGAVAQYEPSSTASPMFNFVGDLASGTVYNIIEDGNARSVEHILCSKTQSLSASGSLYNYISTVTQPHFTTDFPAILANDPTQAAGLTARDGFVGAFSIPPVPTLASLTPAAIDFGSVYRGTSATQSLTFTNTSPFPSNVRVSSLVSTNPADFTQTSNCASLSQGASCTIDVVFAPSAAGVRSATVTVNSDSGANPVLTATLTGTGVDTTATLAPLTASFPTTMVGLTSAAQTFTWTNTSPVALTLASVTTTGDFAVSGTTCTGSVVGACTVSVIFAPTAAGPRTGTLTINSSSSLNPSLTSTLTGTGVATLVLSPSPLDFGNVDLGFPSGAKTLTLTNYGAQTLGLKSLQTSGDYTFTSGCGPQLAPGGSCSISVVFQPTALGPRPGSLNISTTSTTGPVLSAPLNGNGVDFLITVAPTSGTTIAGYTAHMTVTLTPFGGFSAPVTISCLLPSVGGSVCGTSPGTVGVSGPVNVPATITTTAQYTVIGYGGLGGTHSFWLTLIALLTAGALCLARRGAPLRHVALLMLLGLVGLASGCSGRLPVRKPNPTLPGSYVYTFSASDGRLVHTAQYTLGVTVR